MKSLVPMICAGKSGFILPLTFVICAAILLCATLLLRQNEFEFEQSELEAVHFRARDAVRQQVPLIVDYVERQLSEVSATTFLQKAADPGNQMYRTHLFTDTGKSRKPMGSFLGDTSAGKVLFRSPVSGISLLSDRINVAPPPQPPLHMAWSLEDIALAAGNSGAAPWWPLQDWHFCPYQETVSPGQVFNRLTGLAMDDIEWIPENQPLAFRPEMSPAFTPVVYRVGLRFGIFASGNVGQREKMVRMRYYIDCGLWNPYNRDLEFHAGNRPDPVFQVVMWNLPKLRIINITQGISTGWISMDELVNPQTGATGIHGWVRMHRKLAPAESVVMHEPDSKDQPEGLARLVHPSFMLGPADEVHVQFQPSEQGVSIACMELHANSPLADAKNGEGWFRVEDFAIDLPDLEFDRADAPDHPFYLATGSLSFREQHVQMEISADRMDAVVRMESDPRRKTIRYQDEFPTAAGIPARDADLVRFRVISHIDPDSRPGMQEFRHPALFSWPAQSPESLLQVSDIPQWRNAFRTGSKDAVASNQLLDQIWPISGIGEITVANAAGALLSYNRAIHINAISPATWLGYLTGPVATGNGIRFAMYPSPVYDSDYLNIRPESLKSISSRLAFRISNSPSHSISDFFNKGILADGLQLGSENPLHRLLPLRGLQQKGGRMTTIGGAMIVHITCSTRHDGLEIVKSARLWLLRVAEGDGRVHLDPVYFEWTDPSTHVVSLN